MGAPRTERAYYITDPSSQAEVLVGTSSLGEIVDIAAFQFHPDKGPGTEDDIAIRKGPGAVDLGNAMNTAIASGASQQEVHTAFNLGMKLGRRFDCNYYSRPLIPANPDEHPTS